MRKRYLFLAAALGVLGLAGPAAARHGGPQHLPPTQANVDLVGQLQVSGVVAEEVTDVATYRDTAFLGNWGVPDCPGGFWSIDISNPSAPRELTFVTAPPQTYLTEGLHALRLTTPSFTGDVLVVSNETCAATGQGGISIYDVTNPASPVPLSIGKGDTTGTAPFAHDSHSAFAWDVGDKAYAALIDNEDGISSDIDIMDITDPRNPVLIKETGLAEWGPAQTGLAFGEDAGVHDLVVRRVEGHWEMLVSYWDAGYVRVNVNDPANPRYIADSDYPATDPLTNVPLPEGNGHEAEWDRCPEEGVRSRFPCGDVRYILAADEDFSPYRASFAITTGGNAGPYGAGEFGFSAPLETNFPNGVTGPAVWAGTGCPGEDLNGNGLDDRAEVPAAATIPTPAGQQPIAVFTRGLCFFSDKIATGEMKGYRMVAIGNHHVGAGEGLTPNAFICGGQGSPVAGTASAICIGHRAMHLIFEPTADYTGPSFTADMPPVGTIGATATARAGVFDGWGYLHLIDAGPATGPAKLRHVDAYAVPEALDPRFARGFGDLSIHEITTDPTGDVGYIAWYAAGFRVVDYSGGTLEEVGRYIDSQGSNLWGVELNVRRDGRLFALASDRDYGLYIFRFGTDLRPTKVSSPRRTRVGNTFSYRIAVGNTGTITETATVLRDRLPRGVRFVSASATQGRCSYRAATRTVVCNLGRLVNDAGRVFVTIRVEALRTGTLRNVATIQGRKAEYDFGNNSARATTRVLPAVAVGGRLTGGR